MRLQQEMPPGLLNMTEHKWEQTLGPCSNAVTPYEGPKRVDWLLKGEFNLSASGGLRQMVSEVLNCKDLKSRFSVPHLLIIMHECRWPLPSKVFNALYRKINNHFKSCYGLDVPQNSCAYSSAGPQVVVGNKARPGKNAEGSQNPKPPNCMVSLMYHPVHLADSKSGHTDAGATPVQATCTATQHLRALRGRPFIRGGMVFGTLCKTSPHVICKQLQKVNQRLIMRHCGCEDYTPNQKHSSAAI